MKIYEESAVLTANGQYWAGGVHHHVVGGCLLHMRRYAQAFDVANARHDQVRPYLLATPMISASWRYFTPTQDGTTARASLREPCVQLMYHLDRDDPSKISSFLKLPG